MFGAGARILRVKSLTNIHTATYHTFSFCTKGRNTRAAAKYSNCLTKSTKHDFLQIKLFTMKKFFYTLTEKFMETNNTPAITNLNTLYTYYD